MAKQASDRATQTNQRFGGYGMRAINSMASSLSGARHGFTKRATIRKRAMGGG